MDDLIDRPASVFFFDLESEADALQLAKEMAVKIGRRIVVRRPDGSEAETVYPTNIRAAPVGGLFLFILVFGTGLFPTSVA